MSDLDLQRRAFEEAMEMTSRASVQDAALATIPKVLDDLMIAHGALRQPKEQSTLALIEAFSRRAETLAPLFKLAFGG